MRGKELLIARHFDDARITPAYAGKSEHAYLPSNGQLGSPPHVRGKERSAYYFACFVGITPACAGKRFYSLSVSGIHWDHPRMCGEKRSGNAHRARP